MKTLLQEAYAVCVPYTPRFIAAFVPPMRKYLLAGQGERFFIHQSYVPRPDNLSFDDTPNTDEWQREVYLFARDIFIRQGYSSVCDLGCGSGYKLVTYFNGARTIGIDLPPTCTYLRSNYPQREWREFDLKWLPAEPIDMVIAADVIEHLRDPDEFLNYIGLLTPKLIVLSTPDRNLMGKRSHNGPPTNPAHVREWSFWEFHAYIEKHFAIEKHFISNVRQGTQCILCRPRAPRVGESR